MKKPISKEEAVGMYFAVIGIMIAVLLILNLILWLTSLN